MEIGKLLVYHGAQLGISVISYIKIRKLVVQAVPQLSQVHMPAAVLIDQGQDNLAHLGQGCHILFLGGCSVRLTAKASVSPWPEALFARGAALLGRAARSGGKGHLDVLLRHQVQMDESVAGPGQRQGGLGFPHAQHEHVLLPQAHGQPGEVAVAGDQAEALYLVFVEDIHGVYHHGHVGGVLSRGVGELLHRHDGIFQEHALRPAVAFGPVAVDAPVAGGAVFLQLLEYGDRVLGTDIVRVYQHRELHFFIGHGVHDFFHNE